MFNFISVFVLPALAFLGWRLIYEDQETLWGGTLLTFIAGLVLLRSIWLVGIGALLISAFDFSVAVLRATGKL